MNLEKMRDIFRNGKSKPMEIKSYYAVLLPLICIEGKIHIIYEVRAKHMKTQPGEISFPGGKVEIGENFREAAIRETYEEIGIPKDKIEVIGKLDFITRESHAMVYPYIGVLHVDYHSLVANPDEVDEIFAVPIEFFLDHHPEEYQVSYKMDFQDGFPYDRIPNGENYKWRKIGYPVFFYDFEGHMIWGMTAKITKNFIEKIKKELKGEIQC